MKKVLIVDDMSGWRKFHETNLRYLGIDGLVIDSADCAKSALAKIEVAIDSPYDTILTDMQMESDFLPKLAGMWLIEQIQMFKEYKNTKIVIISASPQIARIAKHYKVSYIPKYDIRNSSAEIYREFL